MPTCLSIVQTVCARLGFQTPNIAIGSQDPQINNIVAISNEEGQELAARSDGWTELQTQTSYTTVATEDQGLLSTIAPGCKFIINDTIWNRSLRRPVFGPTTPQGWQQQHAYAINGPWSWFRIQGGHLKMFPVPVAGQDCYFEYVSSNWLTDTTGATGYEAWNADTDIPKLDYQLLVLGTIWRWKKHKGLEYAEDFNTYERRVMDALGRSGGKNMIDMSGSKYDIQPVVLVASGSWNL